jgi:zinc D-Ala-D-Ala carboxypeptidase
MNLSQHVTIAEFEHSSHNISNKMNDVQIASATLLCQKVFEPLRLYLGRAITISSGYRSPALNRAVKGSATSQHSKAEAMDVNIGAKGFHYIKDSLDFDQLIWEFGTDHEPAWVHVSYKKSGNRKQVLKAIKSNGKTKYINY